MTNFSDLHNLIVHVSLLKIDKKNADVVRISLRKSAAVSGLISKQLSALKLYGFPHQYCYL